MRYEAFGRLTGLRVSEFALGTGQFGTALRGYGADKEEARRIFDGFAQAGGNFIDTADLYQSGESESFVGEFIAADRDHFVVASKYGFGADRDGGISKTGNSRKNLARSLDASLRRLNTDRIDLYWVHCPDPITPIDEILRALDDQVRAGKILYVGLSNFPAWRVAHGATLAQWRGWAPIAGLQLEYSLVERAADRELLPAAEAFGIATTFWSPLGGGFLTGKYRQGADGRLNLGSGLVHRETEPRKTRTLDLVLRTAAETGAAPSQIALAWLRHRAGQLGTTGIPILGARTRAQLDENLAALSLVLPEQRLLELDEASEVELGYPHRFAQSPTLLDRIVGGDPAKLRVRGTAR